MDRVFKAGASGTPPLHTENASSGYATGGNPGTGTPATKPGAYWFHMITEEIRAVIVAAGLTPDKANVGQLAASIAGLIAGVGVSVLNRDVTQNEVINTAAETTVYSFSVPGNTLGTFKALRLTLLADHFNNTAGSVDLTIRVKFGATTILAGTLTITNSGGANRLPIIGEVILAAFNSAAAQIASGDFVIGQQGTVSGTMSPTGTGVLNGMHNAIAEDSTAAKTLSVTVQHASASANVGFRLHTAHLELLP